MKKQPRFAFTLVESLVVSAVLLLLSALLFGAFSRVRDVARVQEGKRLPICLSNQKQILSALQLYQKDSAGYLPLRDPMSLTMPVWIDALRVYVKSPQVFLCPSETDVRAFQKRGSLLMGKVGKAPSARPGIASTYIASEDLLWKPVKKKFLPRAIAEIKRPASTIFLSDGVKQALPNAPFWTNDRGGDALASGAAAYEYILREPSGSRGDGSSNEAFAPNPRHNGHANVGFVDGHVKSLDLSKWYFPNTPYLDPTRGG